jgi:hypothetical protein
MPRKTQINLSDSLPQVKPQGGQPKLAKEMRGHSRKPLTHEYVAAEIAKAGYILRSQYERAHADLDIECDRGHRYPGRWSNFQQGNRCPECARNVPLFHEYVASEITKAGYVLRSQYERAHADLDIECDRGHRYPGRWSNFRRGRRCPECARNVPLSHEYVASEITKAGYVLRSQYERANADLDIECDRGHRYPGRWSSFQQGNRCPECAVSGYKSNKPGRLYCIRFDFPDGLSLYKIGITNNTIKRRFCGEPTPYTILLDYLYEDGSIPPKKERILLASHAKYKYKGPNLLVSGNTECFTRDILDLDRPICGAA